MKKRLIHLWNRTSQIQVLVAKLTVALTLFLVASFLGVKMLHQYTVAQELGDNNYN